MNLNEEIRRIQNSGEPMTDAALVRLVLRIMPPRLRDAFLLSVDACIDARVRKHLRERGGE